MLDISKFFRIRNDRLEVFVSGLSIEFSLYVRTENPENIPDKRKYRVTWISDKIKQYLKLNSLNDVLLDCRMENFFMNYIGRSIIDELDLKPDQVLILTSSDPKNIFEGYTFIVDISADANYGYFYSKLIEKQIDWENIVIDIPIMSLSGRPTENRAHFSKNLLDICNDKIRISFGNIVNFPISPRELDLYTSILHPYQFPLSFNTDDKILDHPVDMQIPMGENIYKSLISIVNETNDFDSENIQLSEKSFKFFAWHQIPVFNATRGHVAAVRDLGFDMFDDIIDHSYDYAPNIHIQKLKILNVVAKFLKEYPTVEDVNNLRKSIFHRLKSNNDILHKMYEQRPYEPWPYYG